MSFFSRIIDYIFGRGPYSKEVKERSAKFVNLAPTADADKDWIYFAALDKAMKDPDVRNIALTGPYGSGKSSVIRSFVKRSNLSPLEISLAAFLPDSQDARPDAGIQEIERSILQQMLYGQDAGKLPLSRFKRIRAPKHWNWVVSLFILLGSVAFWILFQNRSEIVSGEYFLPFDLTNWQNLSIATLGSIFLWIVVHNIYLKSFGVSLKSISLTDVEITTQNADKESILNRHLDEIIYFFQSTSYDLVVIEDLDRFENSSIFVTLREINALVNKNDGVSQTVRFLYALRDDVFKNTDRTKFFEFIVPIVPIINHSNSIDMVLEEGQRLSLEDKLDKQFLLEVSRFLNDLRLIKNIFNEFVSYEDNLKIDSDGDLDRNKLLAVLIYKNVRPSDFEKLHQQEGTLAQIFAQYERLVATKEAEIQSQIEDTETAVADAKKQLPRTLQELRSIYAMAIVAKMPNNHSSILLDSSQIPISALANHERFEEILGMDSVTSRTMQNQQQTLRPQAIEHEVDPNRTYLERKKAVEQRSAEQLAESAKRVLELRDQLRKVRTEKFKDVIRANYAQTENLFAEFGDSEELIRFLIFEGYLDDSYYQYISLFHSGRLSPNDNNFLRKVRGYDNPDPDFRLDNAAEVIATMRDDDFSQEYVLNRFLMDALLDERHKYHRQLEAASRFISANFSECQEFFSSYYTSGKSVGALLDVLINNWDGFVSEAIVSDAAHDHIANLMCYAPTKQLVAESNKNTELSDYLNAELSSVLHAGKDIELEKVAALDLRIEQLSSLLDLETMLELAVDGSLYRITEENIRIALECKNAEVSLSGLKEQNYTTVLASGAEPIIEYIDKNFERYLRDVLMKIEENVKEDPEALSRVLGHSTIPEDVLGEFLVKQDAVFESFQMIPEHFHKIALENGMISPTWTNLAEYTRREEFDANALTSYMKSDEAKDALMASSYEHNNETLPLSQFIFSNFEFSDTEYRSYVSKLPVSFKNFPAESTSSTRIILIEEGVVKLSEETFNRASEDPAVLVQLLLRNIDVYLEDKATFAVNDDLRAELLDSDLSADKKLQLIDDFDLAANIGNDTIINRLGNVFAEADADFAKYPAELLRAVITARSSIEGKIDLFNKVQSGLSDDLVREVIQGLPAPFPDFLNYGWISPRIPNTSRNRNLVQWLEERKIISSSKVSVLGDIKINTFRKERD